MFYEPVPVFWQEKQLYKTARSFRFVRERQAESFAPQWEIFSTSFPEMRHLGQNEIWRVLDKMQIPGILKLSLNGPVWISVKLVRGETTYVTPLFSSHQFSSLTSYVHRDSLRHLWFDFDSDKTWGKSSHGCVPVFRITLIAHWGTTITAQNKVPYLLLIGPDGVFIIREGWHAFCCLVKPRFERRPLSGLWSQSVKKFSLLSLRDYSGHE